MAGNRDGPPSIGMGIALKGEKAVIDEPLESFFSVVCDADLRSRSFWWREILSHISTLEVLTLRVEMILAEKHTERRELFHPTTSYR